jgi:membrane protease YdiL (CAAX protease family)
MFVHPRPQDIVGEFPHTTAGVVLFVVLAVVMAPVFEEIFFRGFLFRGFAGAWGWGVGAVVSAAIFGLAHLQLDVFVPLFTLGLLLAWVYKRTGSLWTNISLHALFNALSVLAWVFTR